MQHTVTPIEELVATPAIPAIEPRLRTTSDGDTFILQKRYGDRYKIIDLDIAEGERVFAALAEWLDK